MFPGFTLPEELRAARADPAHRPRRDRSRSSSASIRTRPRSREEDYRAPLRQDQGRRACGASARPSSTAAAGSIRSACAWCSRRCRSTGWASTTRAAASSAAIRRPRSGPAARSRSRSTRCPRCARASRRSSPSPSRRAAPIPPARSRPARSRRGDKLGAQRHARSSSRARTTRRGAWCSRAPTRRRAAAASRASSSSTGTPGFHRASPIRVIRTSAIPNEVELGGLRDPRREPRRRRRGRGSISPSICW